MHERESRLGKFLAIQAKHTGKESGGATQGQRDVNKKKNSILKLAPANRNWKAAKWRKLFPSWPSAARLLLWVNRGLKTEAAPTRNEATGGGSPPLWF